MFLEVGVFFEFFYDFVYFVLECFDVLWSWIGGVEYVGVCVFGEGGDLWNCECGGYYGCFFDVGVFGGDVCVVVDGVVGEFVLVVVDVV